MAHIIETIRKRSTFILIREKGKFFRGKAFNLQFLKDKKLENKIMVGFTATKSLGKAVKRNKAKRIMRELSKAVLSEHGKINSYYVIIAKPIIFNISFENVKNELKRIIL